MTEKRRPGRPPLKQGEGKNKGIFLRLSEEERLRYQEISKRKKMTMSAWIRSVLGNQK